MPGKAVAEVSASMSDHPAGIRTRSDVIDFWRGYLLCTIFINHIPGNAFEPLTQKNFGFSDSAEGFVFISGLALALAYGRRFSRGDRTGVTVSLARRATLLYGLHVFLSLAGLAIFVFGAIFGQNSSLLSIHGRDIAVSAPLEMVVGVFSLGHQFGYFNILPMYIMMLAITPILLLLAQAGRWSMLAASFALYISAICGCNLPNWPEGGSWFFNPFAWQFMVAIGIAVGLRLQDRAIPRSVPLLTLAAMVVIFGAFCVTDGCGLWPGLEDEVRVWGHLDKTTLGLGRLVHFLAIAYLMYGLRVADRMRGAPAFGPLCAIGRHGLWMFCVLSLMAAGGQVVVESAGHTVGTDVVMVAGGLCALAALARHLDARQSARRPREEALGPPPRRDHLTAIGPAIASWSGCCVKGEAATPVYAPR